MFVETITTRQVRRGWFTPDEVAVYLGLDTSRIYALIRSRKLEVHRFTRGKLSISRQSLEKYIAKCEISPSEVV